MATQGTQATQGAIAPPAASAASARVVPLLRKPEAAPTGGDSCSLPGYPVAPAPAPAPRLLSSRGLRRTGAGGRTAPSVAPEGRVRPSLRINAARSAHEDAPRPHSPAVMSPISRLLSMPRRSVIHFIATNAAVRER